jgi:hypothetical protein
MSQGQMMTPQERRIFTQQGTTAAAIGAINTAVALFANPAAALAIGGGTSQYPLASWVTVTNDANAGTTYKFTRKGHYFFHVVIPGTAGDGGDFAAAVGLDTPAAQWAAATFTPQALTIHQDFSRVLQAATVQQTAKLDMIVPITDTLAGTTNAANGTPNGTVRIGLSNNAGAAIDAAALVDAEVGVVCTQINELFG